MGAEVRRFGGQVALVTGGGSGIGQAVCERLAAEGARVWVADIDKAAAERLAKGLRHGVARQADVSDDGEMASLIAEVVSVHGSIDVLINNAGVTLQARTWETSPEARYVG